MAVLFHTNILLSACSTPSVRLHLPTRAKQPVPTFSCSMTSSSDPSPISPPPPSSSSPLLQSNWQKPLLEFPHLSPSHRNLMLEIISAVDSRLASELLPSSLSPDVASFHSPTCTAEGSLDIRFSSPSHSKVDFILACWLHSRLPSGASLDITTIIAFLNNTTDAPHLSLDFIRSSPTSLVLFLDFLPRRDIALYPDYLQAFYENTHLDNYRQRLHKALGPKLRPFVSSSLYIRSVLSPTAISVSIESEELEEMLAGELGEVVKEVVGLWVEECGCGGRMVEGGGEMERDVLMRRDYLIKMKAIEADLSSNLPRMFGPDVAGRVIEAIQKAFGVAVRLLRISLKSSRQEDPEDSELLLSGSAYWRTEKEERLLCTLPHVEQRRSEKKATENPDFCCRTTWSSFRFLLQRGCEEEEGFPLFFPQVSENPDSQKIRCFQLRTGLRSVVFVAAGTWPERKEGSGCR